MTLSRDSSKPLEGELDPPTHLVIRVLGSEICPHVARREELGPERDQLAGGVEIVGRVRVGVAGGVGGLGDET